MFKSNFIFWRYATSKPAVYTQDFTISPTLAIESDPRSWQMSAPIDDSEVKIASNRHDQQLDVTKRRKNSSTTKL